MPSVIEGLSMGGEDLGEAPDDPFAASFLAKQAGEEPPAEDPGTPEEPPAGQPRDQQGRFAPAGTPEPTEGTPTEGEVDTSDPEYRYAEAQKVIGRQGTELGEERAARQALEARLAALETSSQQQAPQAITFIAPEVAEQIVDQNGPEGAVILAIEEGVDPDSQAWRSIFDAAAEAADTQADAVALLRLEMQYRAQIDKESAPAPAEPTADPALDYAKQTYLEAQVQAIAADVRGKNPDFDTLVPHFEAAATVAGLKGELESGDPVKIQTAVATMVLVARGIASQAGDATSQAGSEAAQAAAALKQAAQVATGSLRSAGAGAPEVGSPEEEDAEIAAFKKAFRETATPSVATGLSLD